MGVGLGSGLLVSAGLALTVWLLIRRETWLRAVLDPAIRAFGRSVPEPAAEFGVSRRGWWSAVILAGWLGSR